MRRDEDPLARRRERGHQVAELDAGARVEPRGGLVQDEQAGVVEQGLAQVQPLAHALREAGRRPVGELEQSAERRHRTHRADAFAPSEAVGARGEVEELRDGEVRVGDELVRHEPDVPADLARLHQHAPPLDPRVARVREVEGGEDAHRRRLPGAVRADEAEDLATFERERELVHRSDGAERAGDPLDVEQRASHRGRPPRGSPRRGEPTAPRSRRAPGAPRAGRASSARRTSRGPAPPAASTRARRRAAASPPAAWSRRADGSRRNRSSSASVDSRGTKRASSSRRSASKAPVASAGVTGASAAAAAADEERAGGVAHDDRRGPRDRREPVRDGHVEPPSGRRRNRRRSRARPSTATAIGVTVRDGRSEPSSFPASTSNSTRGVVTSGCR